MKTIELETANEVNRLSKVNELTEEKMIEITKIIEDHQGDVSRLLEILLEVQRITEGQYISKQTAYFIAEKLAIKPARIYDVITFFSAIYDQPRAKYPIQMCSSIVCKVNDGENVFDTLREILGIELGEVTYDGKFTLEVVPCFGACDVAPAVRVNEKVYGRLTSKGKILEMLNSLE